MSRAYRIKVKESLTREITAEDSITSSLEIIEVLPCDQMADLLEHELKQRGFEEKDGKLVRQKEGVEVRIDPKTGEVVVQAQSKETICLEGEKEGRGYDDVGPGQDIVRKNIAKEIRSDLEKRADQAANSLQAKATEKLEGHLRDLQPELDQIVNRVTAEALKQKAATLGQIKQISEDPQSGSLTITLEV